MKKSSYVIVPPNRPDQSTVRSDLIRQDQLSNVSSVIRSKTHPLENRLKGWDATQDEFKLKLKAEIFGVGFPMRMMMERRMIRQTDVPLPGRSTSSNLHLDILLGKDETLDESDVFITNCSLDMIQSSNCRNRQDFHSKMEKRLKI
ncbi:proteasome maturation factor UMP1-domain-containing protein [Phakopsora pachyrhizi]|uniref:Proteasome maturation factor UMP1-domain-containing protein n=1 Tax=Phakopsora pachyrhizi TaxID=170000 RepID=A0AAV0BV11_PHAPC|nr:proteasome maturation factor UMP1-domain-containing protein [Phakopsora pachyrhizi]